MDQNSFMKVLRHGSEQLHQSLETVSQETCFVYLYTCTHVLVCCVFFPK